MSVKSQRILSSIRSFLFAMVNKEFLIFLFFLVLSGIFWLLTTLNETYEREIQVGLQLVNVPKNVVVTTELPEYIRVTVRDKGYMIGGYLYAQKVQPLQVDFTAYADGKGHGTVAVADLQKLINQQLYKSSKIVGVKADKMEFYYNFGRHKKVPVRVLGSIQPSDGYYLSQTVCSPDSVTVYAAASRLDSIDVIYTQRQVVSDFSDTITMDVPLQKIARTKCVPTTVRLKLCPDIMTEERVEVPVEAINMSDNKVLRTFPSKVMVRFVIGANQLRLWPKNAETKQLLPNGFRVAVDYRDIAGLSKEKCKLHLLTTPRNVSQVQLETTEVDYLIENK